MNERITLTVTTLVVLSYDSDSHTYGYDLGSY